MKKTSKMIAYIWLCFLLGGLLIFLKLYFDLEIDDDSGAEMVLSNLVSQGGGFLRKDWFYSTELRILNTELVYGFLFKFTNNWHVVRIVGNGIMYVLLLATVWYLTKQVEITKYYPFIGALFIIPLSSDYYFNALHGAYLLPHITFSSLLMALFLHCLRENKKRRKMIILVVLIILTFIIGLSGIRHVFVFFFPLFMASIWMALRKCNPIIDNFSLKNGYIKSSIFSMILLFISSVGFLINHFILKKIFGFSTYYINNESYFTVFEPEQFLNIFNGWLKIYGYQTGKSIFSVQLVCNTLPLIIILAIIVSIKSIISMTTVKTDKSMYTGNRVSDNKLDIENENLQENIWDKDNLQQLLAYFYISGVVILTLLFTFSTMFYADRYITPISVFGFIIIFIGVEKIKIGSKEELSRIIKAVAIVLFCFLISFVTLINFNELRKNDNSVECRNVADILIENGYNKGYSFIYGKYGNNLIEYTDGKLDIWQCIWDGSEENFNIDSLTNFRKWLQRKEHLVNRPSGKVFVIIDNKITKLDQDVVLYSSEDIYVYGYESVEKLMDDLQN